MRHPVYLFFREKEEREEPSRDRQREKEEHRRDKEGERRKEKEDSRKGKEESRRDKGIVDILQKRGFKIFTEIFLICYIEVDYLIVRHYTKEN